jgi:hypothetical protein
VGRPKSPAKRFEVLNFLPLILWFVFIISGEMKLWPSATVRIVFGVFFLVSFYAVSFYVVFRKNLARWLIALIILPPTAFFAYIALLFLRPKPRDKPGAQPA